MQQFNWCLIHFESTTKLNESKAKNIIKIIHVSWGSHTLSVPFCHALLSLYFAVHIIISVLNFFCLLYTVHCCWPFKNQSTIEKCTQPTNNYSCIQMKNVYFLSIHSQSWMQQRKYLHWIYDKNNQLKWTITTTTATTALQLETRISDY